MEWIISVDGDDTASSVSSVADGPARRVTSVVLYTLVDAQCDQLTRVELSWQRLRRSEFILATPEFTSNAMQDKSSPRARRDDMRPPPMAVRLAADLRPSADGSAVRTSLVVGAVAKLQAANVLTA